MLFIVISVMCVALFIPVCSGGEVAYNSKLYMKWISHSLIRLSQSKPRAMAKDLRWSGDSMQIARSEDLAVDW
ncbi:hypothetical protein [Vibrio brasiliensis]|uniref:hypothetical protein n=1 Tax=Vibrio brasiliensis TaxID=170652 RepID=UPI001EFDB999|nr:hypothetical protein [Vibrio brasiliensis]MCG9724966.1 hypothetical protein [Vibrio brasiliensis]